MPSRSCARKQAADPLPASRELTNAAVHIGIALTGDLIVVSARCGGRQVGRRLFPAGPAGTAALGVYLANWQAPLRLAIAAAGAAAIGLALTLGTPPGREVFLVSPAMGTAAHELARYAERAI